MRSESIRRARRVVVAWDGSARAARAMSDALPFLRVADSVHVVSIIPERDLPGKLPGMVATIYLARHGVKANDEPIFKTLDEAAVSYQAVLTKVDKLKQAEIAKVVENVGKALAKHPAAHPHVILTSSQTGLGIEELRAEMAAFALAPADGEG